MDQLWCRALRRIPECADCLLIKQRPGVYRLGHPGGRVIHSRVSHAGLQVRVGGGWVSAESFLRNHISAGASAGTSTAPFSMSGAATLPNGHVLSPTKSWANRIGLDTRPDFRNQRCTGERRLDTYRAFSGEASNDLPVSKRTRRTSALSAQSGGSTQTCRSSTSKAQSDLPPCQPASSPPSPSSSARQAACPNAGAIGSAAPAEACRTQRLSCSSQPTSGHIAASIAPASPSSLQLTPPQGTRALLTVADHRLPIPQLHRPAPQSARSIAAPSAITSMPVSYRAPAVAATQRVNLAAAQRNHTIHWCMSAPQLVSSHLARQVVKNRVS